MAKPSTENNGNIKEKRKEIFNRACPCFPNWRIIYKHTYTTEEKKNNDKQAGNFNQFRKLKLKFYREGVLHKKAQFGLSSSFPEIKKGVQVWFL